MLMGEDQNDPSHGQAIIVVFAHAAFPQRIQLANSYVYLTKEVPMGLS
jgi:hypothetical protein